MTTTPQRDAGGDGDDDAGPRGGGEGDPTPRGRRRRPRIPRTPAEPEVREFLRRLKLELVSLSTKARAVADRADTLAYMIQQIESHPAKVAAYADAFAAGFNTAANNSKAEKELRARAATGIDRFSLIRNPDGTCTAHLDNCRVELPPKIGLLLEILAADTGVSHDGMVAWKQPKDIAMIIERVSKDTFHAKALNQLLCRLRAHLRIHANFHRNIIQRNPEHGLRLALRCRPRP